jgi:outer membrane protein assembly factor BamB
LKTKSLLFILFLAQINIFAQRAPTKTLKMPGEIMLISQNQVSGIIIIKEGDNIRGIDPETKTEVWVTKLDKYIKNTSPLADVISDKITEIPNTPFHEGVLNKKIVIFNTDNGQIMFKKPYESFQVLSKQFLPETNEYIFLYKQDKKVKILLINTITGKEIWGKDLKDIKESLFSNANIRNKCLIFGDKLFTLFYGSLSCLDKNTGKIIWALDLPIKTFFIAQNQKQLIISESATSSFYDNEDLNAVDLETGKKMWKNSLEANNIMKVEDWTSQLLVAQKRGFNFYDIKTEEKFWKKDIEEYSIKKIESFEDDFLFVTRTEMMLINEHGENLWKKYVQISETSKDEIIYLNKIDDRIFFVTQSNGNMINYKTGERIWKKSIRFSPSYPTFTVYDEKTKTHLVFNNGDLYKFNPKLDIKPEPFATVNVKYDKDLTNIDLFDWGVSLTGPEEVIGLGLDGKVKYQNTYKQPGEDSRRVALYIGQSMGGYAPSSLTKSDWNLNYRSKNENNFASDAIAGTVVFGLQSGLTSALGGALVEKYQNRFNAMRIDPSYVYIYSIGEKKERLLIKIRKSDGKEVDKVLFTDVNPDYVIDMVSKDIFYAEKNLLKIFIDIK